MSGPTFDDFLRRVHSDCVNAKPPCPVGDPECRDEQHAACRLPVDQAARIVSAAFNLDGEAEKLEAEEREALLESFAMRCQPMPDTYRPVPDEPMPIGGGLDSPDRVAWRARYEMQRISTWPWVYAAAVLAARPGGAK